MQRKTKQNTPSPHPQKSLVNAQRKLWDKPSKSCRPPKSQRNAKKRPIHELPRHTQNSPLIPRTGPDSESNRKLHSNRSSYTTTTSTFTDRVLTSLGHPIGHKLRRGGALTHLHLLLGSSRHRKGLLLSFFVDAISSYDMRRVYQTPPLSPSPPSSSLLGFHRLVSHSKWDVVAVLGLDSCLKYSKGLPPSPRPLC